MDPADREAEPRDAAAADQPLAPVNDDDRWSGAIAYLAVICWVPYFIFSDRPFVLHHAKQGVALFLAELIGASLLWILDVTVGRIPFLGLLAMGILQLGYFLGALGLSVLGFARAISGEKTPLPWIGRRAEMLPDPPSGMRR
jgi:uncharacterized membrane protein